MAAIDLTIRNRNWRFDTELNNLQPKQQTSAHLLKHISGVNVSPLSGHTLWISSLNSSLVCTNRALLSVNRMLERYLSQERTSFPHRCGPKTYESHRRWPRCNCIPPRTKTTPTGLGDFSVTMFTNSLYASTISKCHEINWLRVEMEALLFEGDVRSDKL
ncbi:hypothetical protein EG68_03452 [Paragonimus skrjabini miyazakii]|uniref:Uncharacterized protein n=1 Tax=Paragonimus skrjabini miyazakii TaxID=59628 RepID=A0A8S9YXL9_9TREM|nr:hypothetical protein EG68_03452 [Paragonimus skrjabini miyazakii]